MGVVHVYVNRCAFTVVEVDGTVVMWGDEDLGGDASNGVRGQLMEVSYIHYIRLAYPALNVDGSAVPWGASDFGGDSSAVQEQLVGVDYILCEWEGEQVVSWWL